MSLKGAAAMNLVLIGPPGSGKGTIAKIIADNWNLEHVSAGDLLRAELRSDSELAGEIRDLMEQGQLVPDSVVTKLLANKIDELDQGRGMLLDGYPRNLSQADLLQELMESRKMELDHALHVMVPNDVIVERLSSRRVCTDCGATYSLSQYPPKEEGICDRCGGELALRDDDKPETVRERLNVFESETKPVLQYYEDKGLLVRYDNSGSLNHAAEKLKEIL